MPECGIDDITDGTYYSCESFDEKRGMPVEERLNKWLSRMGVCSRREADRLIEEGKDPGGRKTGCNRPEGVLRARSVVCGGLDCGEKAGEKEKTPRQVLLAVNKPRGIVCTTSDKDRAQNIVEFLAYPERIYPIGRLDKDSQGLLLMTNQGDLVNKIMRCGNGHEKEYEVTIRPPGYGGVSEKNGVRPVAG